MPDSIEIRFWIDYPAIVYDYLEVS